MSERSGSQGTWVMGVPANPNDNSNSSSNYNNPQNYAHYQQASNMAYYQTMPSTQGNPYVATTPASAVGSHGRRPMDNIFEIFDKCGKKVDEFAKKIEEYVANIWQHLRIGPSLADTAMGRIAQGTKLLTEGGYENVFRTTFDVFPGEKLQKAYACYLSTSAGPVVGTLYLSNMRLAFCSDNPLAHTPVPGQTQWSYYKVVVPLSDLKAVNPSANRMNSSEKYIQVVTSEGHEFWFLGFVTYDKALKHLENVVRQQTVQTGGTH